MAGKVQKPFDMLQDRRRSRRRPVLVLRPLTEVEVAQRNAGMREAMATFDRWSEAEDEASEPATPAARPPKAPRKCKPDGDPVTGGATLARSRPRDEHGRFIPMPSSRRSRIRARIAGVPEALAGLVAENDDVLSDLARVGT